MILRKKTKTKEPAKASKRPPRDWRDAARRHLAKVRDVDAVFAFPENGTVHIYSVVADIDDKYCKRLMKQEALVEKECPTTSFEFHTRAHQGREPNEAVPWNAELVYLR